MERLSSMNLDEKSSAKVPAHAPPTMAGILNRKHASITSEEKRNADVPSNDLPKKRHLPHLDPMRDERGSDMASTNIEATATGSRKMSIVSKQEPAYEKAPVGRFRSFSLS